MTNGPHPPCPKCGGTKTEITCFDCDAQTIDQIREHLNLPPDDLSKPYKGEGKETVMAALAKTVSQRDRAETLLRMADGLLPFRDDDTDEWFREYKKYLAERDSDS